MRRSIYFAAAYIGLAVLLAAPASHVFAQKSGFSRSSRSRSTSFSRSNSSSSRARSFNRTTSSSTRFRTRSRTTLRPTTKPTKPGLNNFNRLNRPNRLPTIKPRFPQPGPKLNGLTRPGKLPTLKPGLRNPGLKLNGLRRPGLSNQLPSIQPGRRNPGLNLNGRKRPGLNNKLPNAKSNLRRPSLTNLNRVGKFKGIKQYQKLLGKTGKPHLRPIKPIRLNQFKGNFGKLIKHPQMRLMGPKMLLAKRMAIRRLSLRAPCHWWINFICGCHWHWHHCYWWDICYTPGYWHCWTPCHYNIVYCPPVYGYTSSAWYFGVDCFMIPDMAAFGIKTVKANSPAALAGLAAGDLIVSINGNSITDAGLLRQAIQTSNGNLQLGVMRDGMEKPAQVNVALRQIVSTSF